MPNAHKDAKLTLSQIGKLRATAAKRTAQILSRVSRSALGELDKPMTQAELKAASIAINAVLPAQASQTFEDVTEDHGKAEDVQANMHEYLKTVIHSMSPDDIKALLDNDS